MNSAFWNDSGFRTRWGVGKQHTPWQPEHTDHLSLDPDLVELFQTDGWCSYGDGLLLTQPPRLLAQQAGRWLNSAEVFPLARSAWGHLITWDGEQSQLIDVQTGSQRVLGVDIVTVFDVILGSKLLDRDLRTSLYKKVRRRLGAPEVDECYAFVPPLALGGGGEAESVNIVKFAPHLDLLYQVVH